MSINSGLICKNNAFDLPDSCQNFRRNIQNDISEIRHHFLSLGLLEELKRLHCPSLLISLFAVVNNWCLILIACWLCTQLKIFFLPFCIAIVGNRQRALGNLLHEASHGNFGASKHLSEGLAELLVAIPLFAPLSVYRPLHNSHHNNLGCSGGDVDLIHDYCHSGTPWHRILFKNIFSWQMWCGPIFGLLTKCKTIDRFRIFIWWVATLGVLAQIVSPEFSVIFFAVWFSARSTVFHFITVFREISDHFGLIPGSIIGFTRNNPTKGILRRVFHPHNNGYHLIHHLDPRIPFFALPKAHLLLLKCPRYAMAEHCDSYFSGLNPVIRSWEGQHNNKLQQSETLDRA